MNTSATLPRPTHIRASRSFARLLRRTAIGAFGVFVLFTLFSLPAFAQGGDVTRLNIKSAVLGEDRVILVRTPAGYATNKLGYPVLYMTDGDAHMAHTSSTIEFLARNGRMSEMILVGIPNTDRTRDLSPTKPSQAGATGAPQFPTAGGADNFLKFIETELIPEIEKQYRVRPYRVLAGHSLGGLFAVHAMISRPELFNSYLAVSPALQWDNQIVVKRAEDFFKARKEFNATFFMSMGNEPGPIEDGFHQFKQLLTKNQVKGFAWEAQEMPDEDHGTVVLRSHYFGLRKVYDGWQIPRDPNMGTVVGGLKAADEHYKKLSDKFHFPIPVPEALVNQIGYQHLFGDQNEEAIAVFKLNVERYPDSANVYDSLAEAYEKTGRIDLATPLYEKAQALGHANKDPNAPLFRANYERANDKLKAEAARKAQPAATKKSGQ
ncbi:MAG: alpha/beta hydrolase-fold protein [Pyrinomonadaceae bacterium]